MTSVLHRINYNKEVTTQLSKLFPNVLCNIIINYSIDDYESLRNCTASVGDILLSYQISNNCNENAIYLCFCKVISFHSIHASIHRSIFRLDIKQQKIGKAFDMFTFSNNVTIDPQIDYEYYIFDTSRVTDILGLEVNELYNKMLVLTFGPYNIKI